MRCSIALDMAVEHRGVGAQPEFVGRAMDVEPRAGVGLAGADFAADLGIEDFGPAAGHAAQAGRDQVFQDRPDRPLRDLGEMVDLHGGPRLQVQAGKGRVQVADHAQIPVERLLRMHAADDVQFGAAGLGRLLGPGENLGLAHRVRPRIVLVAAVGAQGAAVDADVGRVEVQVEIVVGRVAVLAAADHVGQFAHGVQIDLRREQKLAVGRREAFAGFDFLADFLKHLTLSVVSCQLSVASVAKSQAA